MGSLSTDRTESGGVFIKGDIATGKFYVEWDANGKLVSESIEIREAPKKSRPPKCQGCGGAKYDKRAHLQPGAMDEVIQEMD